jgi:hypothetical protein
MIDDQTSLHTVCIVYACNNLGVNSQIDVYTGQTAVLRNTATANECNHATEKCTRFHVHNFALFMRKTCVH